MVWYFVVFSVWIVRFIDNVVGDSVIVCVVVMVSLRMVVVVFVFI